MISYIIITTLDLLDKTDELVVHYIKLIEYMLLRNEVAYYSHHLIVFCVFTDFEDVEVRCFDEFEMSCCLLIEVEYLFDCFGVTRLG